MNSTLRVVVAVLGLAAFVFAQKPVASVQGRVLGPDGEPMVNVEVSARAGAYSDVVFAKARTDGDGMFLLARLQDDRPVQVVAQAPAHTRSIAYADLSPERPVTGVELRLYHANTLRGRVVDAEGRAVAGAQVVGTKDLAWFQGQTVAIETRSDADGRFELQGVPIGDCVVRAFAPGFALREYWLVALEDTEISFPPLQRGAGTTITIATEGLGVDEAANAQVRIRATRGGGYGFHLPSCVESGRLGPDGSWRLAGLPDAEWHVELSLPGVTFDPRSLSTKVR